MERTILIAAGAACLACASASRAVDPAPSAPVQATAVPTSIAAPAALVLPASGVTQGTSPLVTSVPASNANQ
ncbi:MAG: hypothetical protein J0I80_09595 [Sphingomonas sp.]|nr:hypothetical protein [Sphingomonas sp.]